MTETVFTNARVVLADRVIDGSVLIRDGVIADISEGDIAAPSALNFNGDLLIPGRPFVAPPLRSHLRAPARGFRGIVAA